MLLPRWLTLALGLAAAAGVLELGGWFVLARLQEAGEVREITPAQTRFEELYAAERVLHPYAGNRNAFHASGPERSYESQGELFADLVRFWSLSSLRMERLCTSNGIAYHHFLQPNQYVEGSKPFTEEERAVAFAKGRFAFRDAVVAGYPLLRTAGRALRAEGIDFVDLTGLFEGDERPVYVDRCCHMNTLGNRMLAEAVADAIAGVGSAGS